MIAKPIKPEFTEPGNLYFKHSGIIDVIIKKIQKRLISGFPKRQLVLFLFWPGKKSTHLVFRFPGASFELLCF